VSPRDFWALCPGEVWWLIDAHTPEDRADYEQLYQMMMEADQ
jgi:hypothetical protein